MPCWWEFHSSRVPQAALTPLLKRDKHWINCPVSEVSLKGYANRTKQFLYLPLRKQTSYKVPLTLSQPCLPFWPCGEPNKYLQYYYTTVQFHHSCPRNLDSILSNHFLVSYSSAHVHLSTLILWPTLVFLSFFSFVCVCAYIYIYAHSILQLYILQSKLGLSDNGEHMLWRWFFFPQTLGWKNCQKITYKGKIWK